jgi:hypothetical protein
LGDDGTSCEQWAWGLSSEHPQIKPLGKDTALILDGPGPVSCEQLRPVTQQTLYCAHIGSSMNHTLDHSDLLEVSPCGERLPEAGDVILCAPPGGSRAVVHRVVRAGPDGIATRGDNSLGADAWRLQREDIVGRIVAAWRGERRRAIPGGRTGKWQARWVLARRGLDRAISPMLHPFYRALETSGVVRRLLPPKVRPQAVSFETAARPRWRLMFGRREVGRYDHGTGRWLICRPYRLLVDERTLPGGRLARRPGYAPEATASFRTKESGTGAASAADASGILPNGP